MEVSAEEDLELVVVEALVHVVPHQVVLLLLPRLVLLQVCGDLVIAQQPGVDCVRAHVHVVFLFHHRCLAAVLQRVHPLPFWVLLQTIPAQELLPFLPDLLVGKGVMSVGMSEPDAGSSVTELKTSATPDGDDFLVNGSKVFGTNSGDAEVFLIYLRFGPGTEGIGSALIEKGTSGFEIGPGYRYMNGESWSPLYFDNCRIPKANILLGSGGFKKQISGFNIERLGNAARAVAVGRKAFNEARDHAKTRRQFGRDICEFQGLQWKFAEMQMRLEAAQLLLMRAVTRADNGLPSAQDSALAKLACNDAGFFAANEALQIMGALGFSDDNIVQYCMRRTRGWMIAGGSTEILKNRIAEGIFERRFSQRPSKPAKDGA